MNNNIKSKKEVSCRILTPYFYLLNQKGIETDKVLDGIPYSKAYLSKRSERIEWSVYCKIMKNMRQYFSQNEFEEVGAIHVKKGFYPEGVLAGFIFFSSRKISRVLNKQIFRIGKQMFSCINTRTYYPSKNKIIVKLYLDQDKEFIQEFFLLTKGAWNQLGNLVGHKNFKIDLKWVQYGAFYNISWEKESIYFKLKRGMRWMFSIGKAFTDLTDSHQQLLEQYEKLEESKKLLQKQTTQLKITHDITNSIRQSLDIKKTLFTITEALVNDADFNLANIKLYKDLEGNKFEISALSGFNNDNSDFLTQQVIINDEQIGELILSPKFEMDKTECEELLNYLRPTITISIHDALVLRTVTDYKNNLEAKVEIRTTELKKTEEKLSKTIQLLQDAQQAQNRFFTNISHEFKTPLTLILGPAKQIIEQSENVKVQDKAKLIYRSGKKLNLLANQLLDISRIEAGKMKLKVSRKNIVSILKEIVSSFQLYAERKNISLLFNSEEEEIFIYLERDKIDKIMSNLLSNAIKFTPDGGNVNVAVAPSASKFTHQGVNYKSNERDQIQFPPDKYIEISVSDTGLGIPKGQLDKIFDRFYQVDNRLSKEYEGTGVGLSLTKELVELHKGIISVVSEEGKGSTFIIIFPVGKEHLKPDEILDEVNLNENEVTEDYKFSKIMNEPISVQAYIDSRIDIESIGKTNKPSLLIVEDNTDVREYISDILNKYYNLTEASNGEEGLKKSFELIPDLIISDVMMPKMDGFQLCSKLKTDSNTCHIPLILLTAKSTLKDKIEGLEIGADDYIMKPFEADELKARIQNLLEQKKRIHEHFKKHGLFEVEANQVTPIDQKFLQKICEIVKKHLPDPSFNIDQLAEEMSVSKSLLYKKLIALLGEPPGELIRRFRLDKAAKLIESNSGNVTDVAFEVGFNDSSYFASCFKKQFGKSPTQYHHEYIEK